MEIFKLFGSIFVDTTDADKKLDKTNKKGKGIGETLGNGIKTVGKWGAAVVGAAATAGAAMVGMATKTAANCDEIDKMSQKLGLSREAYQEWNYILSQNGADINSLGAGMKTLTAQMDKVTEGNAAAIGNFNKLGLSVYDSTGKLKSQEQMFEETVTALQGMEDGTEKARLATECCAEHNAQIINGAPLLIATLIVDKRSGFERDGSFSTSRKDAWQAFDNGVATQTLCLAANDLGLGTVVMGLYDIDKASDIIGVPEGQLLMALVAVGYPDEKPSVPKKKTVEDLLSYC